VIPAQNPRSIGKSLTILPHLELGASLGLPYGSFEENMASLPRPWLTVRSGISKENLGVQYDLSLYNFPKDRFFLRNA
jgi:hypothetical protein